VIIGVPKEIKTREYRVGMTPAGVRQPHRARAQGPRRDERRRGQRPPDEDYTAQGAQIVATAKEAWSADMVVKVKEPLPAEYGFFRENLILYTYLHLAPEPELTRELAEKKVAAVAYETIELADGSLPLLKPMSEVAGRMAVQVGARASRRSTAARACSSAACPERGAAASSSSAAAWSAATPPPSPSAWARR
jgi:alanine dehydrogenase